MDAHVGDWCLSLEHEEPCRVIAVHTLWGANVAQVWLARRDLVVRTPLARLERIQDASLPSLDHLSYAAAAARIAGALDQDALLAPLEGTVLPLPHQLHALQRAMAGERVRFLLADEVGLGKTIEAGLILRELKARGLVRRILVVAPAGLTSQWVSEMQTHFRESFQLVQPSRFAAWREQGALDEQENLWWRYDQVVCPLDAIKPLDGRRGWSREQLARMNRERFEDLVAAGWDLVIIDEAHRLAGSSTDVARFRLGDALSQAAPYLLLLSATPHQGKSDAFRRLVSFLDPEALPDESAVTRENVAHFVIRTEKRRAIDAEGRPLFQPRRTQVVSVAWEAARPEQRVLYEAVTAYVRNGYNQALREKRTAIGFLMILMQRLVSSSTAAIRSALERRLSALDLPSGQLALFPEDVGEDWLELEGQEQMESLLGSRLEGLANERAEVELLLSAARRTEACSPDVKAEALLAWIQRLQREEADPSLKVLVFTEFVPTQAMLAAFLAQRGFAVATLNGSMNLEARKAAQRAFAGEAQVLISTDAGGEGLNLQFCHVVVNYDLPWNPMKIEQRIGRVDRIGQKHVVRALNFALQETVELRVREVLEEKLQTILDEFGVDKLSDVLDSEEGGADFQQLYVEALRSPEEVAARAEMLAHAIRERARAAESGARLLREESVLDAEAAQRVAQHPLPFWTERMVVTWLRSQAASGGCVRDLGSGRYELGWPGGVQGERVSFRREPEQDPGCSVLTLEDPRVRGLFAHLPRHVPGLPTASIAVPGVSSKVGGLWSLWRIGLDAEAPSEMRVLAVFLAEDGQVLVPTARVVWERLIELPDDLRVRPSEDVPANGTGLAEAAWTSLRAAAEDQGRAIFSELAERRRSARERARKKTALAFEARRRALEKIGLETVRQHRLRELDREEADWRRGLEQEAQPLPSLEPLLVVRVCRDDAARGSA